MVSSLPTTLRGSRFPVLFPELIGALGRELQEGSQRRWLSGRFMSPASVWESEDKFHLDIDVPGVSQEALEVSVHEGKLHVSFERKREEEGRTYAMDNVSYGKFEQVVQLPETIDPGSIEAELKLGVLHISFGKKPEVQPQKIDVRVS